MKNYRGVDDWSRCVFSHSPEIRGLHSMKCSFQMIQNLLYFMNRKTPWKKTAWVFLSVLYLKYSTLWWNISLRAKNLLFLEGCSFQSSGKTKILMHVRKNSRGQKNLLGPPATRPTYSGNNQKYCWGPDLSLNRNSGGSYFDNLR